MSNRFPLPLTPTLPTRWSLVRRATGTGKAATDALGQVLSHYWYPLYAWARRSGMSEEDAADGVQGFFAKVCETNLLARASQERGRLRTWLLSCFRNYLADVSDRARAEKRGGQAIHLSLDHEGAEALYLSEPGLSEPPDALYNRAWAISLLEEAIARLSDHYAANGMSELFETLLPSLDFSAPKESRAELGAPFGMTATAVGSTLYRMRHRYRDILLDLAQARLGITSAAALAEELHAIFGSR